MAITTRSALKNYFRKNAIPTEDQFGDLIDSMVVRREDSRLEAPLRIEAPIDAGKDMIEFYGREEDQALWSLSLATVESKAGFTLRSGDQDRLFMDPAGRLGIGTTDPQARLDVGGDLRVRGSLHVGSIPQEEWTEATLEKENNWENKDDGFGKAAYFKDSLGIVHLRGLIKGGAGSDAGTPIFQLAEGYRPQKTEMAIVLVGLTNKLGDYGRIDVHTDGWVRALKASTDPDEWLSLDGVSFRAG